MNTYLFYNRTFTTDLKLPLKSKSSRPIFHLSYSIEKPMPRSRKILEISPEVHCFQLKNHFQVCSKAKFSVYEIQSIILNDVLPYLFASKGDLILHGSLIHYQGSTVLIAGKSGSGKSTIALESRRFGMQALADDTQLIRIKRNGKSQQVFPGSPHLRSFDEHWGKKALKNKIFGKWHFKADVIKNETLAPCKIIVLDPSSTGGFKLSKVNGSQKLLKLLPHLFITERNSTKTRAQIFNHLNLLVDSSEVYRARMPKKKANIKKLLRAIQVDINE